MILNIIEHLFFKKKINSAYNQGFNEAKKIYLEQGKLDALHEMVITGQNQYICKYCNTPVAKKLLDNMKNNITQ